MRCRASGLAERGVCLLIGSTKGGKRRRDRGPGKRLWFLLQTRPRVRLLVSLNWKVIGLVALAVAGAAKGIVMSAEPTKKAEPKVSAASARLPHVHTNRLAHEKSPYLLQHQHNPVDWHAWGEEAFAKARKENKPIFLSIGYSTCHWCHVMERESFENEKIAR